MDDDHRPDRRVRVEQGIYVQSNGKYAVCFMAGGRPRFRTVGYDIEEARREPSGVRLASFSFERSTASSPQRSPVGPHRRRRRGRGRSPSAAAGDR